MRRTAVAVVLVAVTLGGCSSSSPKPKTAATPQQRYVKDLRAAKLPEGSYAAYSDAALVSTGKTVCGWLKKPQDHPYGPANELVASGWEAVPAAYLVTVAKRTICS